MTSPEDEGIPRVADDDSSAYDSHDPRDPRQFEDSPPALPTDEPLGVDTYGVTPFEATHREPLEVKLRREVPDSDRAAGATGPGVGRLVTPDGETVEDPEDTEDEEIARDSRESDGMTAEEAAMHPISQRGVPYHEGDSYLDPDST